MESLSSVLGCCAGVAVCALLLAAYKLGLVYQLFHKVGVLDMLNRILPVSNIL